MTARATFAGNFFACAGYEIVDTSPFETMEEGISHASSGDFELVVLCSSNEVYAETAPSIQHALSEVSIVVIAGYPENSLDELKKAGITHFIHRNSNVLQTLRNFNKILL